MRALLFYLAPSHCSHCILRRYNGSSVHNDSLSCSGALESPRSCSMWTFMINQAQAGLVPPAHPFPFPSSNGRLPARAPATATGSPLSHACVRAPEGLREGVVSSSSASARGHTSLACRRERVVCVCVLAHVALAVFHPVRLSPRKDVCFLTRYLRASRVSL